MKPASLRAKCEQLTAMLQQVRRERDAALSRMEDLEADVRYYENKLQALTRGAFQRGAETMREACAKWVDHWVSGHVADKLRDMPITPDEI